MTIPAHVESAIADMRLHAENLPILVLPMSRAGDRQQITGFHKLRTTERQVLQRVSHIRVVFNLLGHVQHHQ